MSSNKAVRWVDDHYPKAAAGTKEALLRAYCAGADQGLREAQEILAQALGLPMPKEK